MNPRFVRFMIRRAARAGGQRISYVVRSRSGLGKWKDAEEGRRFRYSDRGFEKALDRMCEIAPPEMEDLHGRFKVVERREPEGRILFRLIGFIDRMIFG